MVWTEGGTYVETDAVFEKNTTHEWNHGIGEIVTALLDEGMDLTMLVEHDSIPWDGLPGQMEPDRGRGVPALRPTLAARRTATPCRPYGAERLAAALRPRPR